MKLYKEDPLRSKDINKNNKNTSNNKNKLLERPGPSKKQVDSANLAKGIIVFTGKVIEVLSNSMFRVEVSDNHTIVAIVSGKIRMKKFRIIKGDTVTVEVNKHDTKKGRIVFSKKSV